VSQEIHYLQEQSRDRSSNPVLINNITTTTTTNTGQSPNIVVEMKDV
jgi:hypothetical protein